MALVPVTPVNVRIPPDTSTETKTTLEAIERFDCLYSDSATNTVGLADNTSVEKAKFIGISLDKALTGGAVSYVPLGGTIHSSNAIWLAGRHYVLSSTAGKMMPEGDLTTGNKSTLVGVAMSTTSLKLLKSATGVDIA